MGGIQIAYQPGPDSFSFHENDPGDDVQATFCEPDASHSESEHQADGGCRLAGADANRRSCQGPGRPIRFALLKTSGPNEKNDGKFASHNELAD